MIIKLFCQKSFTGSALKSKLELAIQQRKLPYQVEEINNTEVFVKEGISTVPAIKIKETIIVHPERGDIDETIRNTLDLMKVIDNGYILVPLDFTSESIHALKYAMIVASKLNKGITMVHIHEPLVDQLTNSAFDIEMMKRNRHRLNEMLLEVGWDKVKAGNHIPIDIKFDTGDAVSHIVPLMNDEKYDLIIMSTKAEDTFWKRILSSVSIEVSRRSLKPVIVVPPAAEIKFPKKIVVGVVNEFLYENSLEFLLDFAYENGVFLEFVHVANENVNFEWLKSKLTEKLLSYGKKLPGFDIIPLRNEFDQVDESLQYMTSHNSVDMLVLMTHHRNLINSLGHRSISKRVLLQPHLPVMILHGEDEKGLGIIDYLYGMIQAE